MVDLEPPLLLRNVAFDEVPVFKDIQGLNHSPKQDQSVNSGRADFMSDHQVSHVLNRDSSMTFV
jgi:hypothetical protein